MRSSIAKVLAFTDNNNKDTTNSPPACCTIKEQTINHYDEQITITRENLRRIQSQRNIELKQFDDQQGYFEQRQIYCLQKLNRLGRRKLSIPRLYIQTVNDISLGQRNENNNSNGMKSQYVLMREAKLCHAMHTIEIQKQQLKLVVKQHLILEEMLQDRLEEEMESTDVMEERLLTFINYVSSDIADLIIEQKERIENQRKELSSLQEKENLRKFNASCTTTEQDETSSTSKSIQEEDIPGIGFSGSNEMNNDNNNDNNQSSASSWRMSIYSNFRGLISY